jgi:hypothetical protein
VPRPQHGPKHADSPPRTIGKLIRFRPDEIATIAERARACGAPVARYIREVALGVTPRARRTQANTELIHHLARIGNNLNQLAHAANNERQVDEGTRLRAVLDEVIATIKRVD